MSLFNKISRRGDTQTPSEQGATPLSVALSQTSLATDNSLSTLEGVVAKAFAVSIFGGPAGSTVTNLKMLQTKAQPKFAIADLLHHIKIESYKMSNYLKGTKDVITNIDKQLTAYIKSNTVQTQADENNADADGGDQYLARAVPVVVSILGKDNDKILANLADLSKDDKVGALATSFETLTKQAPEVNKLNIQTLALLSTVAQLTSNQANFDETSRILEELATRLDSIRNINEQSVANTTAIFDKLIEFSSKEVDPSNMRKFVLGYNSVVQSLSEIDFSKLNLDAMDKVSQFQKQMLQLNDITKIEFGRFDNLADFQTHLQELSAVGTSYIDNLKDMFSKLNELSTIKVNDINVPSINTDGFVKISEFQKNLKRLNDINTAVISDIDATFDRLAEISKKDIDYNKMANFVIDYNVVMKKISEIDFSNVDLTSINKVTEFYRQFQQLGGEKADDSMEKLTHTFSLLEELSHKNIDADALQKFVTGYNDAVSRISDIDISDKINVEGVSKLIDFQRQIEQLNSIDNINIPDLSEPVKNLSVALEGINSIDFGGFTRMYDTFEDSTTRVYEMDSLAQAVQSYIDISNQLSEHPVETPNLESIQNTYKYLEQLSKTDTTGMDKVTELYGQLQSLNGINIKIPDISEDVDKLNNAIVKLNVIDFDIFNRLYESFQNINAREYNIEPLWHAADVYTKIAEEITKAPVSVPKLNAIRDTYKYLEELSHLQAIDLSNIDSFVDVVKGLPPQMTTLQQTLDTIPQLDFTKLNQLEESLQKVNNLQTDAVSLGVLIDNLVKFSASLSQVKAVEGSDISNLVGQIKHIGGALDEIKDLSSPNVAAMEQYVTLMPLLRMLTEEANKIPAADYNKIDLFKVAVMLKKLSEVDYDKVKPLPVDFTKTMYSIIDEGLPTIQKFNEKVEKAQLDKVDVNKATVITNSLNALASIQLEEGRTLGLGFSNEDFINFRDTLYNIIANIENINSQLDMMQTVNTSNIDRLNTILYSLDNIEFQGGKEIDTIGLTTVKATIGEVSDLVRDISATVSSKQDIENTERVAQHIDSLVTVLKSLSMLSYKKQYEIDIEELKKMTKDGENPLNISLCVLYDFAKRGKVITEDTAKNINNLQDALNSLSTLSFQRDPKVKFDKDALKEINDFMPDVVKLTENIGEMKKMQRAVWNTFMLRMMLKNLGRVDTQKFEGKNFEPARDAVVAVSSMSQALEKFDKTHIKKLPAFEEFARKLVGDKDSVIVCIVDRLERVDLSQEQMEKIKTMTSLLTALANTMKGLAMVGTAGGIAMAGVNALTGFINKVTEFVKTINGMDKKDIENAQKLVQGVEKLVLKAAVAMLAGAAIIIMFPKLVFSALVFGVVLGLFIRTVLGAISHVSKKEIKASGDTLKGVASLIIMGTFAMALGAMFILGAPQLLFASFVFGFALAGFILLVVGAIRLVSPKEMKADLESVAAISLLIVACTGIMLIGGLFMTLMPHLVIASFAFAAALGFFLFATLLPIRLIAKDMDKYAKDLLKVTLFIGLCAAIMIFGATIITPALFIGMLGFLATLAIFMGGLVLIIKMATWGIDKTLKQLGEFALAVVVCSAIMMLGGGLFMMFPDLPLNVLIFAGVFGIFTFIMSLALKQLGKVQGDLIKGAAAMAIIGGVVIEAAIAMLILRHAVEGVPMGELWNGVAVMTVTLLAVGGMAVALGFLAGDNPLFWAGAAAMGTIVLIIAGASLAIKSIASAMQEIKKVGKVDMSPMVSNITGLMKIIPTLTMFALGIGPVIAASTAIWIFSNAMSTLAETVANISSLKIPVYSGTKVTGYTHLTKKDFTQAADNTKALVSTLGQAVIDLYNKAPHLFADPLIGQNKFSIVCSSTSKLSNVISGIARGVRAMGQLLVPDRWDSQGHPTHYQQMSNKDIENANLNTRNIVTTLSSAMISIYNSDKKLFDDTSWLGGIFGGRASVTPLGRVISVTTKLGSTISSIASGVRAMGQLLIPDKWDKDGRPIHYVRMQQSDIDAARENTTSIISTLSNALLELYHNNKEVYDDTSWLGGIFGKTGSRTPLASVVSVSSSIARLISSTASGVKSMGMLLIPDKWNNEGKPTHYIQMTNEDIVAAGDNTAMIMTTISNALISLYKKDNGGMYKDEHWWSSKTPLGRVISTTSQIIKLISSTASGVKAMGMLMVPDKWNSEGKPTHYMQMSNQDIVAAGDNTISIVTSLSDSLIGMYKQKKTMYDNPFLGTSPLSKVIDTSTKLTKLVSNVASSVMGISQLQIPDDWNKEGKPIHYRRMDDKDFALAKDNVGKIITTIGNELMDMYNSHEDWFKDSGGFLGIGGDNKFSKVMSGTKGMSELVSNVASSVMGISQLQIPDDWNKEGKPIHYRRMSNSDFAIAKDNIGKVITTIGYELMSLYESKKSWFEDDEDSPFSIVMRGSMHMGEVISNISSAVMGMARLQIPETYDKDGKPKTFRRMDDNDFNLAKKHIGSVVTTIGEGIMKMYDDDKTKDWFSTSLLSSDTPFSRVMSSCCSMSEIVANIGETVANMASLSVANEWDKDGKPIKFVKLKDEDFNLAKTNIGETVSAIGKGIMALYDDNKTKVWFEKKIFNIAGDSPFERVMAGCTNMSQVVANIADTILNIAQMRIPTAYDKTGTPISFKRMEKSDFTNAADNIAQVVTTIGASLVGLYTKNENEWLFTADNGDDSSPFTRIVKSCTYLGNMIKNIAEGVSELANIESTMKMDKNVYQAAGDNISKVVSAIGGAIMTAFSSNKDLFEVPKIEESGSTGWWSLVSGSKKTVKPASSDTPFERVMKSTVGLGQMIMGIAQGVAEFAKLDSGINFDTVSSNIKTVITVIGKAVSEISTDNADNIGKTITNVQKSANAVVAVSKVIELIGKGEIPVLDKQGNVKETIKVDNQTINKAAGTIKDVINGVAKGLTSTEDNVTFDPEKMEQVLGVVERAINIVKINAITLGRLAKNEITIWSKDYSKKLDVIKFDPDEFKEGGKKMGTIISGVCTGLNSAYETMVGTNRDKTVDFDDMTSMLNAIDYAMKIIRTNAVILTGIAAGEIRTLNKDGKVTGTIKFNQTQLQEGATSIQTILTQVGTGVGNAYKSISNDPMMSFLTVASNEHSPLNNLIDSIGYAIQAVAWNAKTLKGVASGNLQVYDADHKKVIDTVSFGKEDLTNGAATIQSILTSIGQGVGDAYSKFATFSAFSLGSDFGSSPLGKMSQSLDYAVQMVGDNLDTLVMFAKHKYGEEKFSDDEIMAGMETINTILVSLGKGVDSAYDEVSSMFHSQDAVDRALKSISQGMDIVKYNLMTLKKLANGEMPIWDEDMTQIVGSEPFEENDFTNGANVISSVITTIANAIATGVSSCEAAIKGDTWEKTQAYRMFNAIIQAKDTVGSMALFLGNLAKGKYVYKDEAGKEKKIEFDSVEKFKSAGTVIGEIISSISSNITTVDDSAISDITRIASIVNHSETIVSALAQSRDNVATLKGFKFSDGMTPIIKDIDSVIKEMSKLGETNNDTSNLWNNIGSFNIRMGITPTLPPMDMFLGEIDRMVVQANSIANAPIESSYKTVQDAIRNTMETIASVELNDNVANQVQDVTKFIKTFDNINVDGVDALTELVRELNKLGINMGNLDKLADAISGKLSSTLEKVHVAMKELKNSLDADGKRKDKHKKEIKESIKQISSLMSKEMKVKVEMDREEKDTTYSPSGDDGKTNPSKGHTPEN